ncbi:MAG TPA: pyridoxal phosphate-dependent aminotransferase [Alphaproteobacteria bacterium]|nr:pyridoxal phosphate-dependent aminotransferase [Alphaproteobacteria bacterium]
MKIARRGLVPPFIVMETLAAANRRAAAGGDVFHLELGEPSTSAPEPVIEEAKRILESGPLGYTESTGLPALRARISDYYRETEGFDVPPDRIVVTTGSSGGFVLAFLAAFDVGDRVALAVPGYPAYRNILTALGIEPVLIETGPETRFQPTPTLLETVPGRLDGLIVASPSNPAGTVLAKDEMRALAEYCAARGIRLVSDEIYHGITYGTKATSVLEASDEAVVINSFSKYFSMMGWRLGWMVVPDDMLRSVDRLSQNLFISPPTLSQRAALKVFDCRDELQANVRRFGQNRAHLLKHLPRAGFDRLAPADGAFYLYADVRHLTNDSEDLCRRLLAETGVAITPGVDFDPARGHNFVRFSYAGSSADMIEAARRLEAWRA